MARQISRSLVRRIDKVRLFLCDVDGVLTDGTVWVGETGEAKQFNIQDGMGLALLRRGGIKLGWISSRPSPATKKRAEELHIDYLHQDKTEKVAAIEAILARAGATWEEVCYMGDDLVDLGALKRAGLAVVPCNAVAEARRAAHHVTRASGGRGAVREVAELILKTQGKWRTIVDEFDR
jgi:3-deoxy-D-manno-octulosonate 8-phosphate phosphatase (KDO 8-P phosphatase)